MDARKNLVLNRLRTKFAKKEVEKRRLDAYNQYLGLAKENAYEAYCENVMKKNEQWGTHGKPHPITDFKWETCVLCRKIIADDPYGHNPFPLCEIEDHDSRACSACNDAFVLPARLRCMEAKAESPEEARESIREYEKEVRTLLKTT